MRVQPHPRWHRRHLLLRDAQNAIAADWVSAYREVLGAEPLAMRSP